MCGEQAVPTTEKAARFVLAIKILFLLQLGIAILDIVARQKFLREGIIGLFLPILLFLGFYKLSHQSMMIYTFMSLFFSVMFLVYILRIIQSNEDIKQFDNNDRFYFIVACVSLGFYILTSLFSFYPYREFKSIQFAENPAFANFNTNLGSKEGSDDFVGYNDPPQYGSPKKNQKNQITYQVFQGQGVKIG